MGHDASRSRSGRPRRVAIIGAGPGGICTGVRLLEAGYRDFVILEKAPGIGGTWWHNRYPGAECDIKSHLYSFSFAPNPSWSRAYARQPEIRAYLEECVQRFGLEPYLRLGTEVRAARWDDDAALWQLTVGDGEIVEADVVVSALGMFGAPVAPDIPGLDHIYGDRAHVCPDCDGYEAAGKKTVVIGKGRRAVGMALNLTTWTRDIIVCTDGADPELTDEYCRKLTALEIPVFSEPIERIHFRNGELRSLVFTGREPLGCERIFFSIGQYPSDDLGVELGCERDEEGHVTVDKHGHTSVPNVFAAGDIIPGAQLAICAAGEGAVAALAIHKTLVPSARKLERKTRD